uniref:mucin-16-like n=1 Tax=Pristiophorus japonicus TaxID=55135 RepID=UPI00398E5116
MDHSQKSVRPPDPLLGDVQSFKHTEAPIVPATQNPNQSQGPSNFNVTFIINNLPFTGNLHNDTSSLYQSASRSIAYKLNNLYRNSNIKAAFSKCIVGSLSEMSNQKTQVYARCSFKNNSTAEKVDRVTVYHQFNYNTKNITTLEPYSLDKNSLYVNEAPNENQTPPGFNVTFTITSLPFMESLHDHTSPLYKSAVTIITHQLNILYRNSNIKTKFTDCNVISLSATSSQETQVYANCSFNNNSATEKVDRVTVYHQFNYNSNNITTLRPYSLDKDSLYINDYHEAIPPTEAPNENQTPPGFNVTFTITSLPFMESLHDHTSPLYKSAATIITHQLNTLYRNSDIKTEFTDCNVISLSATSSQETQVYANCSFNNNSTAKKVDRVTVYHQFNYNSNNITTLVPYSLDKSSLYVNDYHESTPPTKAPKKTAEPPGFNVTFTITSLPFMESLHDHTSPLYKSAVTIITHQLNTLYRNSNIKTEFTGCNVVSLSATSSRETQVYAICSFNDNSAAEKVDRVTVYHQFNYNTDNITTLGPYSLDKNSLYVNGYHESTPLNKAPNEKQTASGFNVTFTITNLPFTESLHDHTSPLYKSAATIITRQLNILYRSSDNKTKFKDCKVMSLSATSNQETQVYAICSFKNKSATAKVDRVTMYHQFNDNTNNINTMGPYSLDNSSLYINGYHEATPPTKAPTEKQTPSGFNVTFTITNLPFMESLHDHTSPLYKSAATIITRQLNILYRSSDKNTRFKNCKVMSLSAMSSRETQVYAICSFNDNSATQKVDRVTVYHQFNYNTNNITTLGPYSLDKNSLYVNGYHVSTPRINKQTIVVVTQNPVEGQKPLCFNVSFVITNLPLDPVLFDSTSHSYQSASRNIIYQLNALYSNSNINTVFSECTDISLSATNDDGVKVHAACFFNNGPQNVDNAIVEQVFRDRTNSTSTLATYRLNINSLQITGCEELKATATIKELDLLIVSERQGDLAFQINFTIINYNFIDELQNSRSPEYKRMAANINSQLSDLFEKSTLKNCYKGCRVTDLSPGPLKVSAFCYFDPAKNTTPIVSEELKKEFDAGTNGTKWLGRAFQLMSDSVSVAAMPSVDSDRTELPYWAIIVIVLVILLAVFILVMLGFLIASCVQQKYHGFYHFIQNPFGIYYTHLNGKK